MKACGIFAASLFGALVAAAPVNKRDVVWVTETAVDYVTVDVVATVWVGAEATSTSVPTLSFAFAHQSKTRSTASTESSVAVPVSSSSVYVAPTTSSSVVVEPTTSSTSDYVEPTTTSTPAYVAPTTSSVEVVPTTTATSTYVAPTTSEAATTTEAPTSTYVAPSTTSSVAAATSSAASSGSSSGLAASGTSYTGDLTWYEPGLGACGVTSSSTDAIVAISQDIFDAPEYATANPNNNPLCGKSISITGKDGSQYTVKIVDRCVGCAESDLDLSETSFNLATSNGDGRVSGMTWTFV